MAKKKGAKKGGKKKETATQKKVIEAAGPTQLELSLRLELESLENELDVAKRQAEEAKAQNDYLREEVERTRERTADYEHYMKQKTVREQAKVQTLSDQSQLSIDSITLDKQRKAKDYDEMKKGFQELILEKESQLHKIEAQIDDLSEFARKREEQLATITSLRQQVEEMDEKHTAELSKLKMDFLDEKLKFQRQAAKTVTALEREAAQEAVVCIQDHSTFITTENRKLRRELTLLFKESRDLEQRENMLKDQQRELKRLIEITHTSPAGVHTTRS
eukprot:m.35125 g.35125  ORF g.35125 m.35125 type:complete len:276 (+) comp9849_c0_seq2:202-1029(+)